jgi:hypothetical protein
MKRMGKDAKGRPFKKKKKRKREVVPLCSKSCMLTELEIKRNIGA